MVTLLGVSNLFMPRNHCLRWRSADREITFANDIPGAVVLSGIAASAPSDSQLQAHVPASRGRGPSSVPFPVGRRRTRAFEGSFWKEFAGVHSVLWSAISRSSAGRRKRILVMQPTEDWSSSHGVQFSAAMSRRWPCMKIRGGGRIGNAWSQCHMRASTVVMPGPRAEGSPQMSF